MKTLKITGCIVGVIGVLAFAGSFVWRGVAVPALVRYPTDLDVSPRYEGTVTIFLDPVTYEPLAEPQEYPLTVERHIEAVGDESSTDLVVLRETLTLAAPGLFDSTVQEHQYVMDRRDMVNVDDPRAWAFTPDNPVNRAGSFRLQFPFDADAETYPVYKNEIADTYTVVKTERSAPADGASGVVGPGGTVPFDDFTAYAAEARPAPITAAYQEALAPIVQLPESLTIDQIRPILARAGIDLDATLAALLPVAEPADVETLLGLASQPVALSYSDTFEGGDLIEPYTGSLVVVTRVVETVSATPDPAVTGQLRDILAGYPAVPEAANAVEVIDSGALDLIPVFTNDFAQTPDSVADIWGEVKDLRDQRRLAERTVPRVLLIGGLVLVVAGAALLVLGVRRGRQRGEDEARPAEDGGEPPASAATPTPAQP